MKTKRKTPDIRFRGFTEDWEQRKLGDNIKSYDKVTTETDQFPVFTSSRNGLYFQKDYFDGNQIASKDNTGYNIVPRGYFTYRHMSDDLVFKFNINNLADYGIVSTLYPVFTTTEDMDSGYLRYQLNEGQEFKKFSLLQKQGGSRTYMYLSKLRLMTLTVPNKIEQIRISDFLNNIDNLITLHQRKLQQLQKVKRGMLLKMFPTKKERTPSLRFLGYEGKWENKRIKDLILKGGSGGTPRSTNPEFYNGDIPFLSITDITSSNGYIVETEKKITKEGLENSSAWIVPSGSICLAMYASVGKLAIANIDLATSQAFYNMVFELDSIRDFSYQRLILANESGEWERLVSTGTQANLNAEKVRNFDFKISKEEGEIKEIGSLFSKLDRMIELQERETELLEETKKGFLQKMFV